MCSYVLNVLYKEFEKDEKDENFIILNNIPFHKYILNIVPYFKNIGYDISEFSQETTKQFQLWLYNQEVLPNNDLDKETFILFDFLSLDIPSFLFDSKSEELFCYLLTKEYSYDIHRLLRHINPNKIIEIIPNVTEEYFHLYWEKIKDFDIKLKLLQTLKETNLHNYALGILTTEENGKDISRDLFWKNWEETKNPNSLYRYAGTLHSKYYYSELENHLKKPKELYWKNWIENKHSPSLNKYATLLLKYNEREKAKELFKLNWEENKNIDSLYHYANISENEYQARELHWKNWKENKYSDSLHSYAHMLEYGIGGEKDLVKARELYKLDWEENESIVSLMVYTEMLRYGKGGHKDVESAEELEYTYLSGK